VDPAAFDAAYAEHRARIYNFLHRLSGRRDVADDLFQETFLKLARHGGSLRPDTNLAAWLFTVARNAWLSHRRWSIHRPEAPLPELPGGDAEQTAEARSDLQALDRALQALPDAAREVLLLVGVEGMAHDQAASVLGTTPEALRQRLSRVRAMLAEKLDRRTKGAI
jgi:RNA polymerase sigma-70 factor (ECF subfamily)